MLVQSCAIEIWKNLMFHHKKKGVTENVLQYTHMFSNVIDTVYGLRSISKWVPLRYATYVPIKQLSVFQQVKQPLDACYKHTK